MSAAQAGILLLSLLWLSFFIKSDCLLLKRLPRLLVQATVACVVLIKHSNPPLSSLQLLAYSHPINTVGPA